MDDIEKSPIKDRYQEVLDKIYAARKRAVFQEVKVVVVTKTQPIGVIEKAIEAGIKRFGENYAEEAESKILATSNHNLEWHMIGHVQSRKANLVAAHFQMMHSLDSLKLASRLNAFCAFTGRRLPVLLEVNVSGESSKYGYSAWNEPSWNLLLSEFAEISQLPYLSILGLMSMPPYFSDPEKSRPYFAKTRRLQEYLQKQIPGADWSELSMGTSSDFMVAVEEGATYVRIGEAILGKRKVLRENK